MTPGIRHQESGSIDFVCNPGQMPGEEFNIAGNQVSVTFQKILHRLSRIAAIENAIAEFQPGADKFCCQVMTFTALILESRRGTGLGIKHVKNGIDLGRHRIVVGHELAKIIRMMPALKHAIRRDQVVAGKLTGMAMTIAAAVFPEQMQIPADSIPCRNQQDCTKQCQPECQISIHFALLAGTVSWWTEFW